MIRVDPTDMIQRTMIVSCSFPLMEPRLPYSHGIPTVLATSRDLNPVVAGQARTVV